ncbi:hypothetical protein M426DRAFT_235324 [Hypoxylon sp. CI-4A]|nr:hypothetical protein M426DRAFT_235324 [Hypoxylon sp. CI-4A]
MASPVVPILDGDFSDESDYGSDFSIGEEGIVNQLLQELGDTTKLPSKPTSPDSSSDHFASLVTIDVLDSLPQPLSSAAKEQQLHELHSPSRSEHVQPDKRKTSPTNNGQYSSDSITKSAACEPSSAPLGDVRYPDREFSGQDMPYELLLRFLHGTTN